MKKIFLGIIIFFSLSSYAFAQVATPPTTTSTPTEATKPVLYVRQGCSHCANVEAFLNKYNLNNQVEILETYNNDVNQKALEDWFVTLKVTDPNQQGVPFLIVDGTSYFVGDVPIIDYFAKKNNITVETSSYSTSTADTIFLALGGLVLFGVLGYGVYTVFNKKN